MAAFFALPLLWLPLLRSSASFTAMGSAVSFFSHWPPGAVPVASVLDQDSNACERGSPSVDTLSTIVDLIGPKDSVLLRTATSKANVLGSCSTKHRESSPRMKT